LALSAACGKNVRLNDTDGATQGPAAGSAATSGSTGAGGSGTAANGGSAAAGGSAAMDADATRDDGNDTARVDAGGRPDGSSVRSSCPAGPFPTPVVQSTKSVCTDFPFTYTANEGPTWVASQNAFFFSNYVVRSPTGGDIIKYTPGGPCEVFIKDVGCNGLAVTPDGNLLAACQQSRSVIRFDLTTKQATTVADGYMGMMLDSPNDLVVHSNGTIYFTNPVYELGNRPPGFGLAVFRIDPAGVINLITQGPCNGIALSPDEKKLYVLLAGGGQAGGGGPGGFNSPAAVWDLDPAGIPSNRGTLDISGDGMAVDCAGNLYASGTISSADGQDIGAYVSDGTNLAFGGADGKTLLVVGRNVQVRELQMNVPGLP
jgi:gluconolactonase